MYDPRRYIGTGAVLALVLLRLVVGWHFFTSGMEKIEYDQRAKQVRMPFTAAPFLSNAKGPLANFFHSQAADGHDWQLLLAAPQQNAPLAPAEAKERAAWAADYQRRRADAEKNESPPPVEFPPFASYFGWASRITHDWDLVLKQVESIAGLAEEQKQAAENALAVRRQQLADYLADENEEIVDYQHQLWRLDNWRSSPEADVPFEELRIAKKTTESDGAPRPWVAQVKQLDDAYLNDLSGILTSEQRTNAATVAAMDEAQTLPQQKTLHTVNWVVTILTLAVGVCLLLGFFTRLASLAGALFLLGVIATQPPWVADASPVIINQIIEFAALLVLAGTKAGRWLGLDFFTYALFSRLRRPEFPTQ
jgi:uncharacterized membrane protein YphA (DoxX/SURF4 family)